MHRIDAAGFSVGNLFTDGNPSTGTPATVVDAAWLNDLQENVAQLVEAAGIVLSKGDYTQLLKAIVTKGLQGCYFNIGTAAGTADAITSSYTPAITALANGMTLYVRAGSANATTTPTFTPASGTIAAKTLVKGNGLALAAGDIAGGGHWIELQYDLTLDKWVLLNPATGITAQVNANIGQLKNLLINGGCQTAQRVSTALSTTATYGQVDRFACWASGTAVSAGNITQDTASAIGRTGYSLKLAGVTITGSGVVYARQRIESINARRIRNQTASFSVQVYHDVGTSINYVMTVRKATAADNFTSTMVISTGSAVSVPNTVGTQVTLNGVAMGDCSNGIEIEVQAQCGTVTTKNFSFTEWQLEEGATSSAFEKRDVAIERAMCQRYYEKSYEDSVSPGSATRVGLSNIGALFNAAAQYVGAEFKVSKRIAPSMMAYWDGAGNPNKACYNSGGTWYDNSIAVAAYNTSTRNFLVSCSGQSGYAQNFVHFTADAEL